jgi:hypothetical protein
MTERRDPLLLEVEVSRTGNHEADVNCLERVISALLSYRGNDRFDLRLGPHHLQQHPGATTWWNPKLKQLLDELLGPNRVRVRPATAAVDVIEEYLGPLTDPSFEPALAS